MRKNSTLLQLCLLFLVAPIAARADAGTPLMWAGMLHLVFLNAVIGVIEALLIASLFRLPRKRLTISSIVGNYFSMIAGYGIVQFGWVRWEKQFTASAPLYYAPRLLFAAVVVSWLLSILLEWPFFAYGVGPVIQRWRTGFRASVCAQTASYALLIPFYLLVSPITLFRDADIRADPGFAKWQSAIVYYINPADGAVWSVRLNGADRMRVMVANVRDEYSRLIFETGDRRDCRLSLVQRVSDSSAETRLTVLKKGLGDGCVSPTDAAKAEIPDTWFDFFKCVDLRPAAERRWTAGTGEWAADGIGISDKNGDGYNLAFETPFDNWIVRNATILPGDQVVFQLGIGDLAQIVLLDMPTHKLALLAMGQGPAVVLNPTPSTPAPQSSVRTQVGPVL